MSWRSDGQEEGGSVVCAGDPVEGGQSESDIWTASCSTVVQKRGRNWMGVLLSTNFWIA